MALEQTNKNLANLLQEVRDQNLKSFVLQAITAKSAAEIAGPDDDKQEALLASINETLKEIKESLAGNVSKALGTKAKKAEVDSDNNPKVTSNRKESKKEKPTFIQDVGEFLGGMKDATKEMARYFLGVNLEEETQSGKSTVLKPSVAEKESGNVNQNNDEIIKKIEEGNETNKSQLEALTQISNNIQNIQTSQSETVSVKPRIKLKTTPSVSPSKPPQARSIAGMMVSPISNINASGSSLSTKPISNISYPTFNQTVNPLTTIQTSTGMILGGNKTVTPLTAGTEDVKEKYTVEAVLQKQQELQMQERQIQAASGGGLLSSLPIPGSIAGAGSKVLSAGRKLLSFAKPAAAMAAVGAGVDYAAGRLGVGRTEGGEPIAINEMQDEANWKNMTMGEKLQSGFARGIEKVGSFAFLGNLSAEARAKRIEKETEFLKSRTPTSEQQGPELLSRTPTSEQQGPELLSRGPTEVEAPRSDVDYLQAIPYNTGAVMQQETMINRELEGSMQTPGFAPPIITNSVNNNQTQSFIPLKPLPRPAGTSFERFQDRVAMG